jgi:hypothetical protein
VNTSESPGAIRGFLLVGRTAHDGCASAMNFDTACIAAAT